MEKLSNEKIAQVLRDTGNVLRAVSQERDMLRDKLASYERRLEVEKLARVMIQKGLHSDEEYSVLCTSLEKSAASGELPIIHKAVDMIGSTNMGFANLNHDETTAGPGASQFEQFVVGSIG